MRCFIASRIEFEKTDLSSLEEIKNKLRRATKDYHVTYFFFANLEKSKVKAIINKINEIKFKAFEIEINRVDFFNKKSYFVNYLNIRSKDIFNLFSVIHEKIKDVVYVSSKFTPHITIARSNIPLKKPLHIVTKIDNITFFKSTLTEKGPIYEILTKVNLD